MKFSLFVAVFVILGALMFALVQDNYFQDFSPMPLKEWQKQFPNLNSEKWSVEECNGVIAVTRSMTMDAGMEFIRISDKEKLGECSFWLSGQTQSPCKPPHEWKCGIPKNYRG